MAWEILSVLGMLALRPPLHCRALSVPWLCCAQQERAREGPVVRRESLNLRKESLRRLQVQGQALQAQGAVEAVGERTTGGQGLVLLCVMISESGLKRVTRALSPPHSLCHAHQSWP